MPDGKRFLPGARWFDTRNAVGRDMVQNRAGWFVILCPVKWSTLPLDGLQNRYAVRAIVDCDHSVFCDRSLSFCAFLSCFSRALRWDAIFSSTGSNF